MRVSPVSASVAVTAAPTFSPAAVFSATERLTAAGLNTGALLAVPVLAAPLTVMWNTWLLPAVAQVPPVFFKEVVRATVGDAPAGGSAGVLAIGGGGSE